ncbi:MAG TPA: SGNH/GDSL hydrolase family protein [Streptosporangiaceae bacterium]
MDLSRRATAIAVSALAMGGVTLLPTHTAAAAGGPGKSSAAAGGPGQSSAASPVPSSGWVASWAASPMAPTALISAQAEAGFTDQTVRNVVYTSVGGDAFRVRVSNAFGTSPLTVGAVSVGLVLTGAQLVPGSAHAVTFGGKAAVTIPVGAQAESDPVAMTVPPLSELAVSLYLPTPTGPATYHQDAQQTGYVAAGNHAADPAATAYTTTTSSWYFVDGLVAHAPRTPGTVVAFGDSITDGYQSQAGANARWPNYLARRLQAAFGGRAPAVVDEGISGNRILSPSACFGVSAEARFARDALSQPGVKDVILLEGINDIGFSGEPDTGCYTPSNPGVTAAQIEAGYRALIAMAHARGVKIFAGTLTPFGGSNAGYGGSYGTAHGEELRQQVNAWISASHAFDAVIDFSAATQDPADHLYLNPPYNSGDNLHPGDLGYEAMADAIPLRLVR